VLGLLMYPLPLAWLGLGGLALLAAARWRRRRWPCSGSPFSLPLGLYLAGGAIGLYASVSPQTAEIRFFGLLGAVGAFFLVLDRVASTRAASRLAGGSLLAVVVAAPLLFILDAPSVTLERLPGPLASLITLLIPAVQPLRHAILADDPAFSQRYVLHVAGLGTLAAFGAGLALGPLLAGPTPRARVLGGLALAWCALFVVLSGMRGAVLSALLAILLFGAMRQRWLLAGALLVVGLAVGVIGGLVRLGTGGLLGHALGSVSGPIVQSGTFRLRQELWDNALFMLGDFRFTGVGLGKGSVREVYGEYFLPVEKGIGFYHAHSSIIQSYLEQGLLGLLGLLGLMAVGLVVGWRTLARARDPQIRSTAISAGAAALALVLAGLTEVVVVTTVGTMLLCASLGLLDAAGRLEAPAVAPLADRRAAVRPSRVAHGVGGILLALLVAVATPLISLAQGTSPPQSVPARLTQPFGAALAEIYLNLGAMEVTKITLGKEPPRAERRQRLATAESLLNRARELDPGNLAIYRNLASVDLAQGQPADAVRVLGVAEALAAPNDDRFWFQLGRLYREAGDVDRAVAAWSRVDPSIGGMNAAGTDAQLTRWGADLLQLGRWDAAVKVNRAAVRAWPINPTPYDSLSAAVARRWGQEAALTEMRGLAEVYSDIPWPLVEMGDLYRRAGDRAEAQVWYQKAAAIAPAERVIQERLSGRSGA
jgi:tetratricopeptide (TPR) repeat protein